jgi:hypothetical protein
MSRGWVAAGAVCVVAIAASAAVGLWYLLHRDIAEPATVADAVAAFRAQDDAVAAKPLPMPAGVYVYDTDGFERTDALGGVTHRYPATSTITVTPDPCGVRLRWDVLRGRYTTWTVCVDPGAWQESTRDERHTFFGVADQTTYTCVRTPFRPAGDMPGETFSVSCATGSATERGHGSVVGRQQAHVGTEIVPSAHVRTRTTFRGGTTGSAAFDFWLARDTGLPVRVTMLSKTTTGSLIGDVHYEEDVSLDLTSRTPRR